MSSLKQKTVSGLIWSFIDSIASSGIQFIIGIILARLLSPREFGLIGMIMVFIAISETFINSGFSSALIRKKNCTDRDYSTVFIFNLIVGILFVILLQITAKPISLFFNEPELNNLIKVFSLVLIIDSISIIQRTILTKRVDFKLQAKISIFASLISGIISISLAYYGYGVWSLVFQRVSKQIVNSSLLWLWNKWRPKLIFCKESFQELFGFGSKLLLSGLIDTLYRNIYYLVIGKFFSASDLGYYTRAYEFSSLPSQQLNGIIGKVSYPILSMIQDDIGRLKLNYTRLIRSTMFLTFVLMMGMAATSESIIIVLIGEQWRDSVIYLQLLCFVGMMYPLHALNLNMLQVQGRSDLFLRLEIIKKIIAIPTIFIGIYWGIKIMIISMMVNTLISYYLNSYWSGKMLNYSLFKQIKDILPSFLLAITMGAVVYTLGAALNTSNLYKLIIQTLTGTAIILLFCEYFNFKDYIYIKEIILEKLANSK